MKKLLTYPITETPISQTVEQFLKARGYSKHLLIRLKHSPLGLSIGGAKVFSNHILKPGEVLEVRLDEPEDSPNIVPTPMDLDLVYEDEDLLVINKPAGLPIHPSQGHYDMTLANGMAWYFRQKKEPFVYRVINRLDRDTTGLLILARHSLSAAILSQMVKERRIHREYLAVASGLLDSEGVIRAPIARVPGSTIMRQVDVKQGDPACTHYRLLHYNPELDCSLAALTLETGRTHQIRVHLKHIGHPVLGDFLYHPDYRLISRQSLHSHKLSFRHPLSQKELVLEAPLPEDMRFVFSHKRRSPLG